MKSAVITKPSIELLKNMRCYWIEVVLYSGRKRLDPEDIGTTAEQLPPSVIASLGSKRIVNPEQLKVFNALKSRAVTLLDRKGVRFLGSWLIPEDKTIEVTQALTQIKRDFEAAKANFMQNYEDNIRAWINGNAGYEGMLQNAVDSPTYVESRLQFGFYNFRFSQTQNANFKEAVGNIANTLYDDIAKEANEMWKNTFMGRQELTNKTLNPLRTLKIKLEGLTLIEPHVSPIAKLIDTVLSSVGDKGTLKSTKALVVQGLVCLLRDREATLEYAQKILDGHKTEDLVYALTKATNGIESYVNSSDPDEETQKEAAYVTEVSASHAGVEQQRFHISSCGLW